MMRYTAERSASHRPHYMDSTMSNGTFFERTFEALRNDGIQPSMPLLLLIGGSDWWSLVTRAAQAAAEAKAAAEAAQAAAAPEEKPAEAKPPEPKPEVHAELTAPAPTPGALRALRL